MKIGFYIIIFSLLSFELYSQPAIPCFSLTINKIGFNGVTISDTAAFSRYIKTDNESPIIRTFFFPCDGKIGFICIYQFGVIVRVDKTVDINDTVKLVDKSDSNNCMKFSISGNFDYGRNQYQIDSISFLPGHFDIKYPKDFFIKKVYLPTCRDTLYDLFINDWEKCRVKK